MTTHLSPALEMPPVCRAVLSPVLPASRFLSEEECHALVRRIEGFADGGGDTTVYLNSVWTGNLRWARNRIISSGDVRNNEGMTILRYVEGSSGIAITNQLDDRHLVATVRRAERVLKMHRGLPEAYRSDPTPYREPFPRPPIWSDATYRQTTEERSELMHGLSQPAQAAGMSSAGYIEVSATGKASMQGQTVWYYPYTQAQYSVTVRDPQGTGSGWAGMSSTHWEKIDATKLSEVALDKCLRSRNPVRLEPGRYTAILEPQAVSDLTRILFGGLALGRDYAESPLSDQFPFTDSPQNIDPNPAHRAPFNDRPGFSMIGRKVIDERLAVRTDNMDPDAGFPPFTQWQVYHPVTWIKDGVLQELAYTRQYATLKLGKDTGGQPQFGGPYHGPYRMSTQGETTSIEEMIATTKRGVFVTRLSGITTPPIDTRSMLISGYTRDGTWLIEDGKITKPIMNFRFVESPLFALNNVEQIGVPQRVFSPGIPIAVPALKVREFNFVSLTDAV